MDIRSTNTQGSISTSNLEGAGPYKEKLDAALASSDEFLTSLHSFQRQEVGELQDVEAAELALPPDYDALLPEPDAWQAGGSSALLASLIVAPSMLADARDMLVAQTQKLDSIDLDVQLQDGSFLLAQQAISLAPQAFESAKIGNAALPTPIAAMGVASSEALSMTDMGAWKLAAPVIDAVHDAVGVLAHNKSARQVAALSEQGQFDLQGDWQFDLAAEPVPSPALQRLTGQVEAWLAGVVGGMVPKPGEKLGERLKNAVHIDGVVGSQGSDLKLTEQAVQEAQSADGTSADAPPAEGFVEDMRFWLQGKHQRAAVVLDKDGQSVRVQVAVQGSDAHVTLQAEHAPTRALLEASLAHLREQLLDQGIELTGVHVQADADGQQETAHRFVPAANVQQRADVAAQAAVEALAQQAGAQATRLVGGQTMSWYV